MPPTFRSSLLAWLDQALSGHLRRPGNSHQLENGGGNVGQDAAWTEAAVASPDDKKRHRMSGVVGVRLTGCLVDHAFAIAMIGGDNGYAPFFVHGFDHATCTLVDSFHRLNSSFQDTRVPHHIRVGKID